MESAESDIRKKKVGPRRMARGERSEIQVLVTILLQWGRPL